MSSAQIITTGEGEGDGNFDFNKWITENGLQEMKDKLKEHGLTTIAAISTTSNEFRSLMSDGVVLSTKGHLIPKLFDAIDKVPKQEAMYICIHLCARICFIS